MSRDMVTAAEDPRLHTGKVRAEMTRLEKVLMDEGLLGKVH